MRELLLLGLGIGAVFSNPLRGIGTMTCSQQCSRKIPLVVVYREGGPQPSLYTIRKSSRLGTGALARSNPCLIWGKLFPPQDFSFLL